MRADGDKIMFEVYREVGFNQRYHVIFFTELDEHDRDDAIDSAMAGDHFFNGFIKAADGEAAKTVLLAYVGRLNQGAAGTGEELAALLAPFLTR